MRKGNCEKGNLDCTNPLCTFATFPEAEGFDLGVPKCGKSGSFDMTYRKALKSRKEMHQP